MASWCSLLSALTAGEPGQDFWRYFGELGCCLLGAGVLLGSCGIPPSSPSSPEWDGDGFWLGETLGADPGRDAMARSTDVRQASEGSSGCKGSPISLDKRDQVTYLSHLEGGLATMPPSPLGPEPMWGNQPMARVHPDCPGDGLVV